MKKTVLMSGAVVAITASVASGAFRGGAVLTNDAWNAEASAAIGQSVTVTRHYMLFDEADDTLLITALDRRRGEEYTSVRSRSGASLFQHSFGNDSVNGVNEARSRCFRGSSGTPSSRTARSCAPNHSRAL